MQSFTYMSDDGILATVVAQRETAEKYPIELNGEDFEMLVNALHFVWQEGPSSEMADWAGDFVSSLAQTLGIEFI